MAFSSVEDGWILYDVDEGVDFITLAGLEALSKSSAYKLSSVENRDIADGAEHRLNKKGLDVHPVVPQLQPHGIFIYALVGTDQPLKLICRGTQLDSSIIADLDPNGPGNEAVTTYTNEILTTINSLCEENNISKIDITGHSLGGSIAQILTAKLLEAKLAANHAGIASITAIDTVLFQSAGVSKELAENAHNNLVAIKSAQDFNLRLTATVKQGDFVSRTGTYLFADTAPDIADVSLVFVILNKKILSLRDVLSVACSNIANFSLARTAFSLFTTYVGNYFKNRIEAHVDWIYSDSETRESCYVQCQSFTNKNLEDRSYIKHVFEKDITQLIPYSKQIKQVLHGSLKNVKLENWRLCYSLLDVTSKVYSDPSPVSQALSVAEFSKNKMNL